MKPTFLNVHVAGVRSLKTENMHFPSFLRVHEGYRVVWVPVSNFNWTLFRDVFLIVFEPAYKKRNNSQIKYIIIAPAKLNNLFNTWKPKKAINYRTGVSSPLCKMQRLNRSKPNTLSTTSIAAKHHIKIHQKSNTLT